MMTMPPTSVPSECTGPGLKRAANGATDQSTDDQTDHRTPRDLGPFGAEQETCRCEHRDGPQLTVPTLRGYVW